MKEVYTLVQRTRRPSPDVNLHTVETVRALLMQAKIPVSRNWLLERLAARGQATTRQRLNRAIGFFLELGVAIEGSKGVQWTHWESPKLERARLFGREV